MCGKVNKFDAVKHILNSLSNICYVKNFNHHTWKSSTITTCFIFLSLCAFGQSQDSLKNTNANNTAALVLDLGGGVGLFLPAEEEQTESTASFYETSYLKLTYKDIFFTRLQFSKFNTDYSTQNTFDDVISRTQVKMRYSNLGLNFGYQTYLWNCQPYIFAGAGATFLTLPTTGFDTSDRTISYRDQSSVHSHITMGVGVNFKESETLTIFVEAMNTHILNLPTDVGKRLNGLSFSIGIKTPLIH